MKENPYSPPLEETLPLAGRAKLGIFCLVIASMAWLVCLFYWLATILIRFFPEAFGSPSKEMDRSDYSIVVGGLIFLVFALGLAWLRWFSWFRAGRECRWGYLIFLFPFYLTMVCGIIGPYLDFFTYGRKGILFEIGFILNLPLVILSFPWITRRKKIAARMESTQSE